ncbi:hypothetical protein HYH03_014177 [Edaphochlamys debaryana]|uniref:Hydroxyproline O-arabinosyltransferase-like domain-containing protein n=1 Tax=Edaphochlamys debaryana TaxID=47281 RepID=A0A835XNA1_9CHLO|nr:hypothetical protein HYH03_014177 [Edaphochlamys debaryana]|eukprot:KAG2487203.1 hypothetical protein HYH03_014177 [Edaphochlamys debaryana]
MKDRAKSSHDKKRPSGWGGTYLMVICFCFGLLGGYLILGSPRAADHHEVLKSLDNTVVNAAAANKKWSTRRELFAPKAKQTLTATAGSPVLPQNVALGQKPPAKGEVSSELAAALKQQQSDKSEQKVAAQEAASEQKEELMKAQQSDKTEQKAVAADTRTQQAASAVTGGTADATKGAATTTATTTAAAGANTGGSAQAGATFVKGATTTQAAQATTAATTTTTAAATTAAAQAGGAAAPPKAKQYVFPDNQNWPITPVKEKMPGNSVHTLFTSNGSPYQNIQARIMVGTYHMVRKMPGGERMVALTRILHRTTPDEVMDEIPTFIAQPLQPECDKWCWFPVADRANAVQQWIDAAEKDPSLVKAPWLLMLETDYVWMKPLPDPGDAYDRSVPGWSFGFDYIAPSIPIIVKLLKEKCPDCDPKTVPNSGPAPVMARFSDFKAATPIWEDLSKWIETHEEAKKQLGWVREMYAWDIGVASNKLNIRNEPPPQSPLISQPPHDRVIGNASMFHYTWGTLYKHDLKEKEFWIFDKRAYTAYEDMLKLPAIPMPPEWKEGIMLQDGLSVTKVLHDTVSAMLRQMNEAIKVLPDLTAEVAAKKAAGKLK